jgi:hypothetical protein
VTIGRYRGTIKAYGYAYRYAHGILGIFTLPFRRSDRG